MVCFRIKSPVCLLQIRSLATTTVASNLVDSTPKPFATVESITKPNTQKLDEPILSKKLESAIALFKQYQFSDAQISAIVQKNHKILKFDVESTLEPKLKFLSENGFGVTFLAEVIVRNPKILTRSLSDHLIPNTEYLKGLFNNDMAAVLLVVKSGTRVISTDLKKVVQPNIDLLLNEGVEMSSILKVFTWWPINFMYDVGRIRNAIETVKRFGIKPTDGIFIYVVQAIGFMTKSHVDKKLEMMRNLGWTDEDIARTMVQYPLCLSLSEDKLRTCFEYFVKTMGVKPEYIIKHPRLLSYSLTKRSIPRCKVIMVLKEKGFIKDVRIAWLMAMPVKDFTSRFILKYPTLSSSLRDLYLGKRVVDDIPV